jgi:hypothetical protein
MTCSFLDQNRNETPTTMECVVTIVDLLDGGCGRYRLR